MKFSIKNFSSKCDQIRSFLQCMCFFEKLIINAKKLIIFFIIMKIKSEKV